VGCGGGFRGGGSAPSTVAGLSAVYEKKFCYMYYYVFCYIYYTAYRVSHVNAHPSPLAVLKSYFFTSHVFSGVRLFAYRFRRLSDGIRPYNIVDGTLTSGLRATVPSTFDGTLTDSRATVPS